MPASCIGTCSACGVKRFWLSDTLSIQLDDGTLDYLPHPGESHHCEHDHGLTLEMAGDRGRLYRVTFFVCRSCGRDGETIEKTRWKDFTLEPFGPSTVAKWCSGIALVLIALFSYFRLWGNAIDFGTIFLLMPIIYWWHERKLEPSKAKFPRADAPGNSLIPEPSRGLKEEGVIGQMIPSSELPPSATGPCCDKPNWVWAACVKDDDRVPCQHCGRGVMLVSDHAIH